MPLCLTKLCHRTDGSRRGVVGTDRVEGTFPHCQDRPILPLPVSLPEIVFRIRTHTCSPTTSNAIFAGNALVMRVTRRDVFKRQQSTISSDISAFFISDASPLIQYGDGTNSGWTPGYALQSDGYDQTLHLTSTMDSIAFNVTGKHPMYSFRADHQRGL